MEEIGNTSTGNILTVNGDGSINAGDRFLTQRMENNAQGLVLYVGKAVPGTATSSAGWQIQKLTYSGSFITAIEFAGGSASFDKVWDDRSSYNYS